MPLLSLHWGVNVGFSCHKLLRGRSFEVKSSGKVSKEVLKTAQEAIRLSAEVDSDCWSLN